MLDMPSAPAAFAEFEGLRGQSVSVPIYRFGVKRWPERIEFDIGSYTNKVLIEYEGDPLFCEIALVRIARSQGWDAAWIDTYHGNRRWSEMPERSEPIDLPPLQEDLLARIQQRHGKRGGCWDVIAWRGQESAFIESKTTDRILENQRGWLKAALQEGVPPDAFANAEWTVQQ